MIRKEQKFVFIHVPKTAGLSLKRALNIQKVLPGEDPHMTASKAKEILSEEEWNDFFKFAIVRNSFDRFVSLYFYNRGTHGLTEEFNNWLKSIFDIEIQHASQLDRIKTNGKIELDFVGRFENIKEDYQFIAKKLNLTCELPRLNVIPRNHYSYYYNDELIELVSEKCAEEIEYFGFKFEKKAIL